METNQFISFRNSTIFYRVYGSGKAVILIHGFGEDGNIWSYIADKLKNNFLVIVPDLPGTGKSEILEDENVNVTVDDYAEVIIHILKKESLDDCIIIGHSMGGYITLGIADKYPEVLNGFGLINSTAYADSEDKKRDRLKSIEFIQKNDAASFLKTSTPGLFADKFKQEHPDEIEKLIDSTAYFTSESLIQYTKAMMNRPQRISVLQTTALPVLFIIGEEDPVVPLEKSLAQCHLPATAYVHILTGAGHMGMMEQGELCMEIISSYLNNF
ncbi:MAG: alpha/beta hydrolase [Ginsengibacter sp.]